MLHLVAVIKKAPTGGACGPACCPKQSHKTLPASHKESTKWRLANQQLSDRLGVSTGQGWSQG